MHRDPLKEVQNRFLEIALPWLIGFLLCAVVIWGYVRLYELRIENEALAQQLETASKTVGELKKQKTAQEQALELRAEALGLYRPDPEEILVIHVPETAE